MKLNTAIKTKNKSLLMCLYIIFMTKIDGKKKKYKRLRLYIFYFMIFFQFNVKN
jgi:hypothetical protein